MKKVKVLSLLFLSFVLSNCSISDGQKEYGGANALFFSKDISSSKIVLDGQSEDVVAPIDFATVAVPRDSYQVTLVFDAENSTAVEGVDFQIVNGTQTVEAGVVKGSFDVKYFQEPAISAGKVAVFKLQSSAIDAAVFKDTFTVKMQLSCQVDLTTFPTNYDVEVFAFGEQAPTHSQTFTVVSGEENTFQVASMWGPNFVAWATGNASYEGQFLYPATIVINCDGTVDVNTTGTQFLGGSGTYDATTGIIDVVITQGLFTSPFDTNVVFNPVQ